MKENGRSYEGRSHDTPPLFHPDAAGRLRHVLARVFLLALAFAAVAAFLPRQSFSRTTTPQPLRWNWASDGSISVNVVPTFLSGTETPQNVALTTNRSSGWRYQEVYACRWTSVIISDRDSFSVPDTCRQILRAEPGPGRRSSDYTMSYTPNSEEIAHGGVVFVTGPDYPSFGPLYAEWVPFGNSPPMEASITGTEPSSLVKNNVDGATVTVTLSNTRYVGAASLGADDFELASGPSGTRIEGVSRTSGTVAVLTLGDYYENYEDLYRDGMLSVRVLAAGHTGNLALVTEGVEVEAATLPETSLSGSGHPYLIVRKSMYPELREKMSREPWLGMRNGAISWTRRAYSPRSGYWYQCRDLTVFLSRYALAYILSEDESEKRRYVNDMVAAIKQTFPGITSGMTVANHIRTVTPGLTFFNAVLAVDIIYDDMSAQQRGEVVSLLRSAANFFINYPYNAQNVPRNWPLNVYGARVVWYLFIDDQVEANKAIRGYVNMLNRQITEDGVFRGGPGYANARFASGNYAKSYAMDVIAFTGKRNLYREPRLISLYEWIYGYSLTPFGTYYSFGDSVPDNPGATFPQWTSRTYSAHRFSEAAGLNAAYAMRGKPPEEAGSDLLLLAYIFLQDWGLDVARPPPSRIFPDGGAYFLERTESAEALAGAMNNVKTQYQDHMHKDANAIHIAAYGENVLRNVGFYRYNNGGPLTCPTCTWAYVNRTAKSSNVVTVDEVDYTAKPGGGITEGFTGRAFDYASGRSGAGFSNGVHDRNFCFVHPSGDANGYFVLFDEVFSESGSSADLYLHPNSDDTRTEATGQKYRWPVGSSTDSNVRRTDNDVSVTVFLATPPDTTEIEDGFLAGQYNFVGEYLHATYGIEEKNARFATVIFPHDKSRLRPNMARIGVADLYTGARIDHSEEVVDFVVQPVAGKADETIRDIEGKGVTVRGAAAWFRMRGDSVESFFLRKGKLFRTGELSFASEEAVSIVVEGTQARVIAGDGGTNLTIRWSDVPRFYFYLNDGVAPHTEIDSGEGGGSAIRVAIPAGSHEFEIVADRTLESRDVSVPENEEEEDGNVPPAEEPVAESGGGEKSGGCALGDARGAVGAKALLAFMLLAIGAVSGRKGRKRKN